MCFSSLSANSESTSATIALRTKFGPDIEPDDGHILNSNLFPVNANGEVLFLSVASLGRAGNVETPILNFYLLLQQAHPHFQFVLIY